jgi:two-component system alkaline phosphatase synthesis response regulator PhoP
MKRILVVEDELAIVKLLEYDLEQNGFEVEIVMDGNAGYELAMIGNYDLILLDLMLPKMNGLEVCNKLRENDNETYIIMLTAMSEIDDKLKGFEYGADDYVTKPFSSRELISRIKAVLRRQEKKDEKISIIHYNNLEINSDRFEVFMDEVKLDFTLKEYQLLVYLIENKNKALSRDELLSKLWGFEYDGGTRIVDVHIFKLRDKLKETGKKIKSIRGVGYMLEE